MPELPEVESYKRYVDATALHQPVAHVRVTYPGIVRGTTPQGLGLRLGGRALCATRRHGKVLFTRLTDGEGGSGGWLAWRFGMTGRPRYDERGGSDEPVHRHERLRLEFEGGGRLALAMPRVLGSLEPIDDPGAFIADAGLGPDALAVGARAFARRLERRRAKLKPLLLDQRFVAGLGNLHADETLFQAGIHPETPADRLGARGRLELHRCARRVLETVVGVNARYRELPGDFLVPRREAGAPCPRPERHGDGAAGELRRLRVSGRTAIYCPRCQPAP